MLFSAKIVFIMLWRQQHQEYTENINKQKRFQTD